MVIKRSELYNLISQYCKGEYVIGLHGVDYNRMYEIVKVNPEEGLNNMISNGLKVYSGRSINGTVKFFGRIDILDDMNNVIEGLNTYRYFNDSDYIVVAIPIIFRNREGKEIFLGSPNLNTRHKEYIGSRGHEKTTLLEECILDNQDTLKPEFILGRYKVLDDNNIDFTINEKHISFNNGIIDDKKYEEVEKYINNCLNFYKRRYELDLDISAFENIELIDAERIVQAIYSLDSLIRKVDRNNELIELSETLSQLLMENTVTKRFVNQEENDLDDETKRKR